MFMSHPRQQLIILALVALVATALAACGGGSGGGQQASAPTVAPTNPPAAQKSAGLPPAPTPASKTAAPTAAPTKAAPTAAPTTAASSSSAMPTPIVSGDAKDALVKVFAAQQAAKAYRATQTVDSNGKTSHRTIEYVAPDRYHMKTDTAEVIIIGGKAYQNANGKWTENPAMAGVFQPMLEEFKKLPVEMTDVKIVGTEDVNGVKATVYQFNSSAKVGDQTIKSAIKVWARPSDNLPIKQEVAGDFAGRKSTTTQTFDYDPNIKVDPPM
ncbi:MAG: hypothetical protein U0822_12470 [Anaerolineae bacterium]